MDVEGADSFVQCFLNVEGLETLPSEHVNGLFDLSPEYDNGATSPAADSAYATGTEFGSGSSSDDEPSPSNAIWDGYQPNLDQDFMDATFLLPTDPIVTPPPAQQQPELAPTLGMAAVTIKAEVDTAATNFNVAIKTEPSLLTEISPNNNNPVSICSEKKRKLSSAPPPVLSLLPAGPPAAAVLFPPLLPIASKKPAIAPLPTQPVPEKTEADADSQDPYAKRQKRLIKNREAANLSRKRRKEYVQQLEDRVTQLVQENSQLRQRITELEKRSFAAAGGASLSLPTTITTPAASLSRAAGQLPLPVSITSSSPSRPRAVAGVALLVLFFFAFSFFSGPYLSPNQASSSYAIVPVNSRTLLSLPGPEPYLANNVPSLPSSSASAEATSSSQQQQRVTAEPIRSRQQASKANSHNKLKHLPFEAGNFTDSHTVVETDDLRTWINQGLNNAQSNEQAIPRYYQSHPRTAAAASSSQRPHIEPSNSLALKTESNDDVVWPLFGRNSDTAYMFCQQVFQILPNEKSHRPPKMSLLVPFVQYGDTNNNPGGASSSDNMADNSLVQIDCQVLGTRVIKYDPLPLVNDTVI